MADNRSDLIIIGAGWYGLIAATTYLKLAPETRIRILDDGKSIGGVWNYERIYPNLFAQVGHGLFEYSFYPMKKEGLTPDRYISGRTVARYLNDFAQEYDLVDKISLETRVTKIERLVPDGTGWRLQIRGQEEAILETSKLIVASGVSSEPYIPNFPRIRYTMPIMHSAEIGPRLDEIQSAEIRRVVVLGAAKSAYDTVFLLLQAGKQVDWIIRKDGSGPLAIMPPKLLGLLNTVDTMATRFLACFSPAILQTEGPWYWFLQRSSVGQTITALFWRNLTRVAEMQAGYSRSANAEKLRPVPDGFGIFWANSGLGLASVPGFWDLFHTGGATVHRTAIRSFVDNKVRLEDGQCISADMVILCTGWTDNLSALDDTLRANIDLPSSAPSNEKWARLDAQADVEVDRLLPSLVSIPHSAPYDGNSKAGHRPWRLYRRLISPTLSKAQDRSIFFPGQIHSVFTPLVAEMQALWGAAFLLGTLPIPSISTMHEEIALWNSWTKRRYLAQGRKHAYSIYDYLAYVDVLARDLGIRTNRKSNPISEIFSTYRPSDYRGLVDEYLHAQMVTVQDSLRTQSTLKRPLGLSKSGFHLVVKYGVTWVCLLLVIGFAWGNRLGFG